MFSAFYLGLALLPFASAAVHDIQVGGADSALVFNPEAIAAEVGDQIVFHFNPKNHTVTQSSFAGPCSRKDGGFDSGFMPVAANSTDMQPTYTIVVNDTQPIWAYCRQAKDTPNFHCGKGMVFSANCGLEGAPNSFTNFKASALKIGEDLAASAAASPSVSAPAVESGYATGAASGYAPAASGYASGAASSTWTAAYGGVTIAPPPAVVEVTQTVTVESSVWTTTYSSWAGSPAPTPASLQGETHKVIVGGTGNLTFNPPFLSAKPRDTIVFEFHVKNHTVTQSSFADPCRKLSANGVEGFDSGFFPVADSDTQWPTWSVTVNDTAPIWAYCRQKTPTSHCGAGMVFAINSDETAGRSFAAFQNVAKQVNGTSAASNSDPSQSATPSAGAGNGAMSAGVGSGALALAIIAVLAMML